MDDRQRLEQRLEQRIADIEDSLPISEQLRLMESALREAITRVQVATDLGQRLDTAMMAGVMTDAQIEHFGRLTQGLAELCDSLSPDAIIRDLGRRMETAMDRGMVSIPQAETWTAILGILVEMPAQEVQ